MSVLFVCSIISCEQEQNIPLLNEARVIERMSEGTWRISNCRINNVVLTPNYNGLVFDFDPISVTVSNAGLLPVLGGWGVVDEGFEGQPELIFTMALTSSEQRFADISEDWKIIESSASTLRLEDINLISGTTDLLTLQKN